MGPFVCFQVSAESMRHFTFSLFIFAWGNSLNFHQAWKKTFPRTASTRFSHQNQLFCTMIHMSDSSDPPVYFGAPYRLVLVFRLNSSVVTIRRRSSCLQLYRWLIKAAANTGRIQKNSVIYSRESEPKNWSHYWFQ